MDIMEIAAEQYGIPSLPEKTSKAMAYVPFQEYNSPTFSPAQGFESGTMFKELRKPFFSNKCGEEND